MANQTVGQLNVTMNLELAKLQAQIDSANKRIANMARKSHTDVAKMAKQMNAALSTIGLGVSVSGVVAFTRSIVDLGGKITDLSTQAGMSTGAFQTLRLVAADSGVAMDQLVKASTQLRRAMQEAVEGSKNFTGAFNTLGLDARILQKLAPERQFELIGRRIAEATEKHVAFNAALEILGSEGAPKLMAFLKELGTEGFDKLADGLKSVNLTEQQLAQLDAAGDKLARMWEITKLIGAKSILTVSGGIARAAEGPYLPNIPIGAPGADLFGMAMIKAQEEAPPFTITSVPMTDPNSPGPLNAAEAAYQAAQQQQIETYNELSRIELMRAKGLDLVGGSMKNYTDQIDATWAGLTKTKISAEALSTSFAFDQDAIDGTARRWRELHESVRNYTSAVEADLMIARSSDAKEEERVAAMERLQRAGKKLWEETRIPAERYQAAIAEIDALEKAGVITADTAARARKQAMDDTSAAAKEFNAAMAQMWNNVSDRAGQAFADMVLEGRASFSELSNIVARTAIEITARLAIVNPLMNLGMSLLPGFSLLPAAWGPGAAIGSAAAGTGASVALPASLPTFAGAIEPTNLSLLPGYADGGWVSAGSLVKVNERGTELLTIGSDDYLMVGGRAGRITPHNRIAAGENSGDTYNFTYHIPAGVTRSELMPALMATKRATIAEIQNMRRRGAPGAV